jgi:group II intron reverse transcriptase/maturase
MTLLFETESKTVPITRNMVQEAYQKVKSNQGSAGVDKESLSMYEQDLSRNLYKLWNRLASGSYFPQAVKEVEIPKTNGGKRKLGIPTVSDRIAQQVIKTYLEPRLEEIFHENSYGYRPMKNAHQAINQVQSNVRNYSWVIDMDIKSYFDDVSH